VDTPLARKDVSLCCVHCGRKYPFSLQFQCDACGGLIDPVYNLEGCKIGESSKPLERYFYLVPFQQLSSAVSLREGNTPCIHAKNLGKRVGLSHLYLKNETLNPTRTTKDRMASCVLSVFQELDIREFVASSTGNSSSSFAFGIHQVTHMEVHLFCGRDFLYRHAYCDHPRVHLHVIDGDFVQAGKAAQKFAREQGLLFEGGFFNFARREGLKLAYFEAFDQLPEEPAVIVQAVSSGMGMYGAYKGVQEYQQLGRMKGTPRFVCAQQKSCAPMYQAFIEGSATIQPHHIIHHPRGIAEAILRGDPTRTYPYLYNIVTATKGCFAAVSQSEILEAHALLQETEGIDVCYASATAVAAAFHLLHQGWLQPTEVILVNLTGGVRV
jgi:threonine synthase